MGRSGAPAARHARISPPALVSEGLRIDASPMEQRVRLHTLASLFLLSETPATPYQFTGGVTLDAEIDVPRLNEALRATCLSLPHFTWRIERGAWWSPSGKTPRVRTHLDRLGRRIDLTRDPPVRVYARGRELLCELHHSLTDGYGLLLFVNHLLANYYGLRPPRRPHLPLDTRDPLLQITEHAGKVDAPRRPRTAPYRVARAPRATRRWSVTYTLHQERVSRLAAQHGGALQDLVIALYLLALCEHQHRSSAPLPVNVFHPVNIRPLFGVQSAFNCSGALVLELTPRRDAPLGELVGEIARQRGAQLTAEHQLRTLTAIARTLGGPASRLLPISAMRLAARLVSRALSERVQTELVTWFGTQPFPRRIAEHVERGYGIPAVKHTRRCALGFGGVGDALCVTFALTTSRARIPAAFLRRLEGLDPGCVRSAPLVLPS